MCECVLDNALSLALVSLMFDVCTFMVEHVYVCACIYVCIYVSVLSVWLCTVSVYWCDLHVQ